MNLAIPMSIEEVNKLKEEDEAQKMTISDLCRLKIFGKPKKELKKDGDNTSTIDA